MVRNSDHIKRGAINAAHPAARRQSTACTERILRRRAARPELSLGRQPSESRAVGPMPRWRIRRTLRSEYAGEVTPMRIATVCSAGVITAEVTDTLFEAAQTMASNHVGALAVLDEGMLVGVISEADLVN